MPIYNAPTRDTRFVINEMLDLSSYGNLPGFESADADMVEAVVNEAGKFCSEVLAPLNQTGDQQGCTRHEDGSVTTPEGFKEAFDQYREAGWGTISAPEEFGGQGLPHVLGFVIEEFVASANQAFGMYPGLTTGAISALIAAGTDEQKEKYVAKMVSGEWLGTMNLTEPHCGTDLGMIRTKAEPQGDGSYAITGTKIFISAGEHDLTSNIIHLVLAKTPGAPDSAKGISLYIVPKFILDEYGEPGERNGVTCGSIEKKMGIHGNSTCVMNYDEAYNLVKKTYSGSMQVTENFKITDWQAASHLYHGKGVNVNPEDFGITQAELIKIQDEGFIKYVQRGNKLPSIEHVRSYQRSLKDICLDPSTDRRERLRPGRGHRRGAGDRSAQRFEHGSAAR